MTTSLLGGHKVSKELLAPASLLGLLVPEGGLEPPQPLRVYGF